MRLGLKLVVVAASLIFALGIVELGVRAVVPITDCYWYFWDPLVGPRLKPNQSGRKIKGREIKCNYHINAQGWNHPDNYVTSKPKDTKRVCLVGDSQVESLQVDVDKAMFCLAAKAMGKPHRPVEWYAFGNSGWGTNIEYEVIRHYALDYQPDLVILLFLQNDPFDCSPYLVDAGRSWPLYYLGPDERLVLVSPLANWQPRKGIELASRSALFRLLMFQMQIYDRLHATGELRGGVGGLPLREATAISGDAAIVPGLSNMSLEDRQKKTWLLIEKLLEASRDECRRRGSRFAVVFRGWMDEIDSPLTGQAFAAHPRAEDPYCLASRFSEMGREWVAPICQRLGIPYLDLTDALKAQVARTKHTHMFVDDKHFNAAAHEAAAAAMADWVERIWSAPPRS